jgi:hypothetical protein
MRKKVENKSKVQISRWQLVGILLVLGGLISLLYGIIFRVIVFEAPFFLPLMLGGVFLIGCGLFLLAVVVLRKNW